MEKMTVQLSARSRSKAIKPPNTTRMATSGIMELMPSAAPRLVWSVLSVSHALKAASLADEPKKVMTQSRMMVSETPTAAAEAAIGKTAEIQSTRKRAKQNTEMPHRMYPVHINSLRLPTRSDRAPINTVVSVAATALVATMAEISPAEAWNIL